MGGAFTRLTAQAMPDKVRQVVNMGSARTAVWYPKELGPAADPLPVPSTVIYSRTDGMTYSKHVCEPEGPQVENIEVLSSHWASGRPTPGCGPPRTSPRPRLTRPRPEPAGDQQTPLDKLNDLAVVP